MPEHRGGEFETLEAYAGVPAPSSSTEASSEAKDAVPLELMAHHELFDAYAKVARRCARILSVLPANAPIPAQYALDFKRWEELEGEVARRRFPTKHPMGFYSCGVPVQYRVDSRLPDDVEPERHAGRYLGRIAA